MIEKNNKNSPKSDSSKLLEEDEMEIPNFKLLYRNTTNPERDKSSGVSSDEETTSSSLVPIPDTLKQLRKSKWTVSDAGEQSETETVCGDYRKSTGNIINSLEQLRKKYTLKNEASVTLKMNSANLILDDILNSTNLNKTTVNNQQIKSSKTEDSRQKTDIESVISTTETSVSRSQPCAHFMDHPHLPITLDYYPSPCPRHCGTVQHMPTSVEKGSFSPKRDLEGSQRKKSLMEKLQDLHFKYRLQAVYRTLQKKRNPFTKSRKDPESDIQGIPGAGCQGDAVSVNESPMCKCDCQFPKKMILDLVESSEMSQSDTRSTERGDGHCTCVNQRKCNCPELIPNCVCVQHIKVTSESRRQNSPHSEAPSRTNENIQGSQSVPPPTTGQNGDENESSLLVEKGSEDNRKQKTDTVGKNFKAGWKHCSKERNVIERTDIYYFDHGNSAYYQTTDNHPLRYTECLVERTDEYATKFWAEFFGTFEIGVAFLISFILQLYRFLFTSIIRSLTVGLLQIFSDYFFKPLLTILFNGIIQPCLILAYNIATSVRDLCRPISEIFGFFAKEVANILRSCRLVDVHCNKQSSCHCENKV